MTKIVTEDRIPPTPGSRIDPAGRGKKTLLVPLRLQDYGVPIVFAPSFRKEAPAFEPLARELGGYHPVYSFVWPDAGRKAVPWDSIERIAERLLQELRSTNAGDTYILGGFCLGAIIALEMARRIVLDGGNVPLLVLIDPILPSSGTGTPGRFSRVSGTIRFYHREGARLYIRHQYQRVRHLLRRLRETPGERYERELSAAHHRAYHRYRAQPWAGRACIIVGDAGKSRSGDGQFDRECGRWKEILTGDLSIALLPGCSHLTILTAGSEEVARRILAAAGDIGERAERSR